MPESVTILEELGVVEVVSVGDISREQMGRSLAQVVEHRLFRELRRVLVDVREASSLPSPMPLFDFANAVASQRVLQDVRFAIVRQPTSHEDLDFLETAAHNRGVQMRVFETREHALDWLLE